MKKLMSLVFALALVAGCDEKQKEAKPRPKNGNGHYQGPGPDGQGWYEGEANLISDRDLDPVVNAARRVQRNIDKRDEFRDRMAELK